MTRYRWLKENGTEVTIDGITFVVYRNRTETDSWYCYYWKVPQKVEEKLLSKASQKEREDFHFNLSQFFSGHEVTISWRDDNGSLFWGWDMNHISHRTNKGYGKNDVDCDWLLKELCETAQDLSELMS